MALHILAIPDRIDSGKQAEDPPQSAYFGAVLCWLLSAGVYIAAKWTTADVPPWTLCFWRLTIACAILLPLAATHFGAMLHLVRSRFLALLLVGCLGLTFCQGMIYVGLHYCDATTAGIIMALAPILTMVLAALALGEKLGVWQAVGALFSLAGVAAIIAHGSIDALLKVRVNPGELWVAGAALCWGLYTVLLRRMKFDIDRLPLLALLLGFGALAALPFYFWELAHDERSAMTTSGFLAIGYVAIPGGALMYLLYNRSVEGLGASRAGMLMYLQTLFVALLAYLILGEALHSYDLTGAALIVAGLLLANLFKPGRKKMAA
jgi:drug/metabolite transporter (DMT)-like permease